MIDDNNMKGLSKVVAVVVVGREMKKRTCKNSSTLKKTLYTDGLYKYIYI